MREIKAKGRMDAQNRWWVSGWLAADFKKACLHLDLGGHNAAMVQLAAGQQENEEDRRKEEEEHQKLVSRMVASLDEGAGSFHKITKPTAQERRSASPGKKHWRKMQSP